MNGPHVQRPRIDRKLKLWLAVVAVLALVVSCSVSYGVATHHINTPSTPSPIPVGSSTQTLTIGGRVRTFHIHRAASLPSPAPLVVMLHGGFGSGSQAESSYGWDAEADAQHFLVVYPDGVNHAWNAGGGCCGTPATDHVDDVAFIAAMISRLKQEIPLDPARIYATGISNGGMMAYRLACDSGLFAAIGPDSATLLGACQPPNPVSVIHIHGTADHNIPYAGGPGDGVASIDGPAVETVIATWRATDACSPPIRTTETTTAPVTTSIATCPGGRAVELITITGAGHQWPGGVSHPVEQRLLHLDPPSTALNATDTIWRFFASHPKP